MPTPRASTALSRFTVLDLTRVRSGPTCVRQLADWGANVIKIEMPPQHRRRARAPGGPRDGSDFQNLHRNKRSMTLNLKSPEGVAVLKKMVKKADVVVENFRPDVKQPARHRLRGPAQDQPAHRLRQHLGLRPGRPLREPARLRPDRAGHGRADVDHRPAGAGPGAGRHPGRRPHRRPLLRAIGILVALLERDKSGKGQYVEPRCCRRRSSCSISRPRATGEGRGRRRRPATIIRPASRPACSRPRDGHINIAAAGQKIWERICEALGVPEMVERPEYANGAAR